MKQKKLVVWSQKLAWQENKRLKFIWSKEVTYKAN